MNIVTHMQERNATRTDIDSIPNPHVAMNEYPNPPWNTVAYEWDATYQEGTPQWYAQRLARHALRIGLQYATRDKQTEAINAMALYRQQHNATHEGNTMHALQRDTQHNAIAPASNESVKTPLPIASNAIQRAPLRTTIGVLTDTHLYLQTSEYKIVKRKIDRVPEHVGDILQMCLDYKLSAIWVHAGTELSKRATRQFVEDATAQGWIIKNPSFSSKPKPCDSRCMYVRGWKSKDARNQNDTGTLVSVGYAEHNLDWKLDTIDSPITVLATLAYLEDALGIPVTYSAGNTGKTLMRELNKERLSWVRPVELNTIPVICKKVQPIAWKRSLTEEEQSAGGYLVAYDKNMQYAASCTGVLLGAGMPTLVTRPSFDMKRLRVGIWHITVSGTSQFDGVTLPHPTNGVTSGWFYSYTVKLLHELGYTVDILEAWVWEESHLTLRTYGEKLWEARSIVDDKLSPDTERYGNEQARAIATRDVKYVVVKSLGWLDMVPMNEGTVAYDWYRPDWYNLIKDNARYQMFWRIRKYLEKGYTPVGVHVDCLYYLSPTSDHERALPLMMERRGKLGGYKQHYKTPITVAEAAPLFNNASMDIGQVNTACHAIDREHLECSHEQ